MGASLGCCGGPSADYDVMLHKTARYRPIVPRYDAIDRSLLEKLQRSLSTSWSTRSVPLATFRSPQAASLTGSRYGLDEHYESESDTEPSGGGSNASVTSGSRLLCDFYNLVLECDHSKFFVDANGRRVKGSYLNEIEILEDYFDNVRRTTVGSRRRRRESVDALPYQPPQKVKNLGHPMFYDRSSNMSLVSNDTSQTLTSESDYWATFMDSPETGSSTIGNLTLEMTFPPKFTQSLRPRNESLDVRRSWVLQDLQLFGSVPSDPDASSSLLQVSPVEASATTTTTTEAPRSCSSSNSIDPMVPSSATTTTTTEVPRSRSSLHSIDAVVPSSPEQILATPIEGSRQYLLGSDELKIASLVPGVFQDVAVAERRRASLTMETGLLSTNNHNASRRLSVHAIAV